MLRIKYYTYAVLKGLKMRNSGDAKHQKTKCFEKYRGNNATIVRGCRGACARIKSIKSLIEHSKDVKEELKILSSYLNGVYKIVDIGGTQDKYSPKLSGSEADLADLSNDWYEIGDDIRSAIGNFNR
jgi:hypothetical protein